MEDFYFSVIIDRERTLCLAPLTHRRIAMSGQAIKDESGYFVFETRGSGECADVEIIAQVLSEESALRLRDMFNMT